jgi:Fe-S cluster assembly protein SufB
MGQFERTLIIVDEGASVTYAEGCHKGGSKVHTIEGLKNIEDIKIGDFVLTHKGRFKQVTNTIKRPYKGKIYNLRIEGDGNSHLRVTEEHPFLYSRRRVQEYKNKVFNKEWRPISGIRKYDYLMMPVRKSDFEAEAMGRTIPFGKNGFQKLKINIPLDEKFFKLLGYFYAEGTVQKEHYLSLTFHKDENEYLNEVISLMEEIFHKKPLVDKVRNNGTMIRLSSTLAARFIAQEFGSTLKTKHIPEYIFHANKKAMSALICGMWNGDGSYDKKAHMFRYNSISSNLAYGYRDILSILGIKSIIFKTKRSGNRHDMYTVTIVRSDNHLFSKIVGVESQNGILLRSSSHLDKDYSYFCIKSIKITEEETEVYNLSVEADESYVCEGVVSHNCSSPVYSEDSLHSAVVEIIALKGARVRYLTVQNWFNDVYNLVTKRAVAYENAIVEWIDGNIGSKVTMKYPSVILKGEGAHGEVLSLAMSKGGQHQDTGGKMIHLASNTSSIITSKSISLGGGRTSYRGLVKVAKDAKNCKVKVNCDALILDPLSRSDTYPYMEINNKNVSISHEATVSKLDKSQIFYLMSKGLSEEEASAMIVSGFIEPIVKHLPMEYAVELNRLIDMEMEGSVG